MKNVGLYFIVSCVTVGIAAGCVPSSTPVVPTHSAFLLPTLIPPTRIPATPTTPPSPTSTPSPLPLTPTVTSTPSPSPLPNVRTPSGAPLTAAPATATTTATATATQTTIPTPATPPTPAIPPGLYVTDLRIDPPPLRGPDLSFYPTFLNSLGGEQNYHWSVYIFKADTQKRIGDTALNKEPIPAGSIEQRSNGSWKWPLGGPCEFFYAQVGWMNDENKIVWFTAPNGSIFQKGFTACPP